VAAGLAQMDQLSVSFCVSSVIRRLLNAQWRYSLVGTGLWLDDLVGNTTTLPACVCQVAQRLWPSDVYLLFSESPNSVVLKVSVDTFYSAGAVFLLCQVHVEFANQWLQLTKDFCQFV